MARMLPDVSASDIEHASEQPVYDALRRELGDDYVVLHSYPWLRPWRGEALAEGEADFVVLHPARGLLVLEVKGGEKIRHDGKRWFRDTESGPREFRDPFDQARRNMHALLEIARERSGGRIRDRHFVHGYAVVFPHLDYEGQPPPNADKAIVICRRNLPHMTQAIETAFAAWTDQPRPLPHDLYRMLLGDCLMPQFRMFRPVGPDLSQTTKQLLELTETQAEVFRGLYVQDRVLVEGAAGSGKTFLALHRALAFAREGRKTLFVCFNKELAAWLRRQVQDDPTAAEFRDLLTFAHFHGLAAHLAAKANINFGPVDGRSPTQAFWDDEAPDLLEQAVLELGGNDQRVHFDAIVVDEAQDFSLGWWYVLTQSLLLETDGPLYAFIDPNQSLRGKVEWPDVQFATSFKLTINCRNTRRIATASASVLGLDARTFARAPVGAHLRVLRATSPSQQKGLVKQELQSLLRQHHVLPEQIAVIGPAAKQKGSLSDLSEVDGIPIVTSVQQRYDGGSILVTTARSFKGLEAEVVMLYDLGGFSQLFRREDLYVACTRAKVLLIAIVHGDECRDVIATARAASEGQT